MKSWRSLNSLASPLRLPGEDDVFRTPCCGATGGQANVEPRIITPCQVVYNVNRYVYMLGNQYDLRIVQNRQYNPIYNCRINLEPMTIKPDLHIPRSTRSVVGLQLSASLHPKAVSKHIVRTKLLHHQKSMEALVGHKIPFLSV